MPSSRLQLTRLDEAPPSDPPGKVRHFSRDLLFG
jgi:hypothetical protein